MRRTKQEAEETRRLIIDSAERVMSEIGYAQTTLSKIAEVAGVTRGAVHFHFTSKADILHSIFDDHSMDLLLPDLKHGEGNMLVAFDGAIIFWLETLATFCEAANEDSRSVGVYQRSREH